jgi:nucleoside-diphosphate-sugar epimerase
MKARLQQCSVRLPKSKAKSLLAYEAPVSFEEGMRQTVAWMKTAGYPVQLAASEPRPSAAT